jgi:lysophospholipase L1-like esterase
MAGDSRGSGEPRLVALAFVGGCITAGVIALALLAFLASRIGFHTIWEKTGVALTASVLEMPDELLDELTALEAVIGNAGNPTRAKEHDTIVVRPDAELGWVLRPGAAVVGYQLPARNRVNLDPPVLYMRAGSPLSGALRSYLEANARASYRYNIDADGHRRTLPEVGAARKILMVGDSGLFGVGVEDEETIASYLQQRVAGSHRVVNAGVGGYSGEQAFEVARRAAQREEFDALVYVAHHNDFYRPGHLSSPELARSVFERFASLEPSFPGGIAVALLTYLEYTAADVLRSQGWERERLEAAARLRAALPALCAQLGFACVDWSDIADEAREREGTIFAPWSLYVDHAHLSARGNRLFAERIHAALELEGELR